MASDYGPLFFASAVLPDGRVVVEGGEYNQYGARFYQPGSHLRSGGQYLDKRKSPHWLEQLLVMPRA